ncbi:hypothetical protein SM124_06020 [Bacillus sp. 31A1R]|uniref:DUF5655 domain-containing protein n=1 Tax=Robertmurraya mangrovi TaxID=3098077 RepID=A0ABU5IVY1_9BACI|nr:hypothetical protein [Bacillus sp. 31A1R]MDZ5471299.1 hypothetical protein [Bacillus sp. 31A1R]
MKELLLSIKKFEMLLEKYKDDKRNTFEFFSYFKSLHRIQTTFDYIPILELGTILKNEKPTIYFELRNYATHSHVIELITTVDMDLDEATAKIEHIKSL